MALSNGTTNSQTNGASHKNGTRTTTTHPLPIVIAGGGCVGLFLALLLTQSTIPNPIIVIEPSHPDPTSTRAMAHQPPTYPILSKVPGLLPELVETGSLSSGLCFRTSVANGSKVIASKMFDNASGEGMKGKGQLLLPQGKFQQVLLKRLAAIGKKVEVRLGWEVTSFTQTNNTVSVQVHSANGTKTHIPATYLLGADGAHSTIRKTLAIDFPGETLDAQLVATDIYFDFSSHGFYDANFIIDPLHYGLIGRINNATTSSDQPALWRVSYGVPVGMSDDEIRAGVHDKLAGMLPDGGKREDGGRAYEVVRIAPYKAQQRCVPTFWQGRVGLVGDAAHLTNPYAGLGLASGIADASSLAEVLIRVLGEGAGDEEKLFEAWSEGRRQKFFDVVDRPSRMAYARVKEDVSTPERVEALLRSDPMVGALKRGMPVMPPSLETKGEELDGW